MQVHIKTNIEKGSPKVKERGSNNTKSREKEKDIIRICKSIISTRIKKEQIPNNIENIDKI